MEGARVAWINAPMLTRHTDWLLHTPLHIRIGTFSKRKVKQTNAFSLLCETFHVRRTNEWEFRFSFLGVQIFHLSIVHIPKHTHTHERLPICSHTLSPVAMKMWAVLQKCGINFYNCWIDPRRFAMEIIEVWRTKSHPLRTLISLANVVMFY